MKSYGIRWRIHSFDCTKKSNTDIGMICLCRFNLHVCVSRLSIFCKSFICLLPVLLIYGNIHNSRHKYNIFDIIYCYLLFGMCLLFVCCVCLCVCAHVCVCACMSLPFTLFQFSIFSSHSSLSFDKIGVEHVRISTARGAIILFEDNISGHNDTQSVSNK